tara:strand:- start:2958 stop:3893 length:936 start_codon:yes stop_codon:yes gene_type:complete
MKKGFVLISTLALILILSFLVLVLSRTIYTDTLKTNIYSTSIEKRIELINTEKILIDTFISNSDRLRNVEFAEGELNFIINTKIPDLLIELNDLSTCFNLNSLVKPFRNIYVKNELVGERFKNFLKINEIDRNKHREFLDRLYDSLDTDSLPEPFGAEDLFYIANENLSLSPDQPYLHKSQIKNLSLLTDNEIFQIYPNICALPHNELQFNINGLNEQNYLVLLAMSPNLSFNDIEKLIINRPPQGYISFANVINLSGISEDRIDSSLLIYKPEYLQINYTFDLEGQFFHFYSVISLKTRNNNLIHRSTSL